MRATHFAAPARQGILEKFFVRCQNPCREPEQIGQFLSDVEGSPFQTGALMMQKWSLVLALITAGVSLWEGRAAVGGQPTQQILKILSDKQWGLTGQVQKPVYEMKQFKYTENVLQTYFQTVEVDGVTKEVAVTKMIPVEKMGTKTITKYVTAVVTQVVDPMSVKAFEIDGRSMTAAGVANRCKSETLVVVSTDEKMIPDYYATIFKPGTIILAVPATDNGIPKPMTSPPFAQPVPTPQPPAAAPQAPPAAPQAPPPPAAPQPAPVAPQPVPAVPSAPPVPATLAPELVFLGRDGANMLKIRQFDEIKAPAELTVKATDSSISPEKQMTVERMTRHSETMSVDWRAVRISQPGSGDVSSDRVKEKLGSTGETTGLLSRDGGQVDAFWLQNIKSSVFVVRGVKLPPAGQIPMRGQGYAAPMSPPPMEAVPRTTPPPNPGPSAPAKESSGV